MDRDVVLAVIEQNIVGYLDDLQDPEHVDTDDLAENILMGLERAHILPREA